MEGLLAEDHVVERRDALGEHLVELIVGDYFSRGVGLFVVVAHFLFEFLFPALLLFLVSHSPLVLLLRPAVEPLLVLFQLRRQDRLEHVEVFFERFSGRVFDFGRVVGEVGAGELFVPDLGVGFLFELFVGDFRPERLPDKPGRAHPFLIFLDMRLIAQIFALGDDYPREFGVDVLGDSADLGLFL